MVDIIAGRSMICMCGRDIEAGSETEAWQYLVLRSQKALKVRYKSSVLIDSDFRVREKIDSKKPIPPFFMF